MKFSTNALVGAVVALSMVFGTLGVAAAQSQSGHPQKLAYKGQHFLFWDYFPYTPTNGKERVASNNVAQKWAKANGATVTETTPSAGVNPQFIANPKHAADVLMGPDDEIGAWYGSHLISRTNLKSSLYTPTAVSACTLAGKTWCYPWALEEVVLYYNKAYISDSKIRSLKTMTQLAAWAKSFSKSHPGHYGIGWQWDETYKANVFMTAFGGGYIFHNSKGYNGKKIIVGSNATVKGLEAFNSFVKVSGTGAKAYLGVGGYSQDLASGKTAIVLTGPWDDVNFKGKINYGVVPVPGFKSGKKIVYSTPFLGVQTLAVNKYSKHAAGAQSLASYMSTHMELPLFHASGRIPATKAGLKAVSGNAELNQYRKAFLHSEPLPNVPQMSFVWNCVADAIHFTMLGNGSAASNLKTASAKISHSVTCAPPA
jgi:maltose-binding protein MalE